MISATGFIEEKGQRTTQFIMRGTPEEPWSGIKDPDKIVPIGVVEIVEWALDQLARTSEKNRPLITGSPGKRFENAAQSLQDKLRGR